MDPDFVRPWNKGYLVWCVVLLGGMLALEPVVRLACEAVLDGRTPRPLALVMRCVGVMEVQGGSSVETLTFGGGSSRWGYCGGDGRFGTRGGGPEPRYLRRSPTCGGRSSAWNAGRSAPSLG